MRKESINRSAVGLIEGGSIGIDLVHDSSVASSRNLGASENAFYGRVSSGNNTEWSRQRTLNNAIHGLGSLPASDIEWSTTRTYDGDIGEVTDISSWWNGFRMGLSESQCTIGCGVDLLTSRDLNLFTLISFGRK